MSWNQSGGYRVVGYHVRQRHGEGARIGGRSGIYHGCLRLETRFVIRTLR